MVFIVGKMVTFTKYVEIGRVVFISNGTYAGKLATIVNVVDGNKVLVDGPSSGVKRCVVNLKDIQLTKFKLKVRVQQKTGGVQKAFDEAKINEEFSKTAWAKKIAAKAKRATLTDFERFKVQRAKQLRNRLIRVELAKLKKSSK